MTKRNPSTPPPQDERPERDLLDDPDLIEFTSRLPEARKVSIKVMSDSGNWRHKGSVMVDSFNLDAVQRRYGGGTYQFAIHGADGRLLKTISNIEIDDLPEDERPATVAPAMTIPAAGNSEIDLLRSQLMQQQTMMLKFIESMGNARQQPQAQTDITQLVTALATLHKMAPAHENPPDVQVLLMKSFEKGLDTAAKIHTISNPGSASPVGEVLSFVRDVFKEAQPLIVDLLKPKPAAKPAAPGVGPAIAASAEEIPEETELDLTPAVIFIKDRLNDGIPPAALAKMVLKQMEDNPETKATISAIVMEQPIEEIVALDPELAAEPLRTQFGEFFGVLRARILADSPAS